MTFAPRCPRCGIPVVWEGNAARPFCSERCHLLDLGAWAAEKYRIPGRALDPADATPDDDSGEDES